MSNKELTFVSENIKNFLENGKKINNKFPVPNTSNTLEKHDKLFMNLMEEIYEVQVELSGVYHYDEEALQYEIIDCICYSMTILSVLHERLSEIYNDLTYDEIVNSTIDKIAQLFLYHTVGDEVYSTIFSLNVFKRIFGEDDNERGTYSILGARRLCPNRKWHKDENDKNEAYGLMQLISSYENFCLDFLKMLYIRVLRSINKNYENSENLEEETVKTMFNMILEKQNKTLNL